MTLVIVLPGTKGVIYAYAQNSILCCKHTLLMMVNLIKLVFSYLFSFMTCTDLSRVLCFAVLLISYLNNAVDHKGKMPTHATSSVSFVSRNCV